MRSKLPIAKRLTKEASEEALKKLGFELKEKFDMSFLNLAFFYM